MKWAAKIRPPLSKGEKLPAARRKQEARTTVGLLRAGARAHTVLCQGLPSGFLHLRPLFSGLPASLHPLKAVGTF